METKYLVTEGKFDKALFEKILPENYQNNVQVIESGGYSAALSMAISILSLSLGKVILVVDAESNSENVALEKRSFLNSMLNRVSPSAHYKVFVISPELEAVFFQNGAVAKQLTGKKMSTAELDFAASNPKAALLKYFGADNNTGKQLIEKIDKEVASKLRKLPMLKSIFSELGEVN